MTSDPTHATSHQRLLVCLAGLAFVICYGRVIASLVSLWSTYALYSYGFAVPLIAAYLFWIKRSRTSPPVASAPDYFLGVPLIVAGLSLLAIGHVGTLITIKQSSLLVTLAGLVLVFRGREALKSYWFSFGYLWLMVPIWDIVLSRLQDPSRLISTKIAAEFLRIAGVPVLRQDATLVLPSVTLDVLRQCSGVNQLVVLLAITIPAAYLWLDTNGRRAALLAFSIVVGYLSNGFRIALVGWLAVHGMGDGDVTSSYTHVLEGLAVSALGYLVIFGFLSLLSRSNTDRNNETVQGAPISLASFVNIATPRRRSLDAVVVVMMLMAASPLIGTSNDVSLKGNLRTLGGNVGTWKVDADRTESRAVFSGVPEDLVDAYPTPAGERRFTGVDDELVRVYRNSSAACVRLYVGYYRRQEEGRELTGDAGHVLEAASVPVSVATRSGNLTLSEVVRDKQGIRRGVLYWYDLNGRIVPDIYGVKAYTIWNGLLHQRTNGAVVMIAWEGPASAQPDARKQAIEFAEELMPVLRRYFQS